MFNKSIIFAFFIVYLAPVYLAVGYPNTSEKKENGTFKEINQEKNNFEQLLDESVLKEKNICTDTYDHICGKWQNSASSAMDNANGGWGYIFDRHLKYVDGILSNNVPRSSHPAWKDTDYEILAKIKNFHQTCLNAARKYKGIAEINNFVRSIIENLNTTIQKERNVKLYWMTKLLKIPLFFDFEIELSKGRNFRQKLLLIRKTPSFTEFNLTDLRMYISTYSEQYKTGLEEIYGPDIKIDVKNASSLAYFTHRVASQMPLLDYKFKSDEPQMFSIELYKLSRLTEFLDISLLISHSFDKNGGFAKNVLNLKSIIVTDFSYFKFIMEEAKKLNPKLVEYLLVLHMREKLFEKILNIRLKKKSFDEVKVFDLDYTSLHHHCNDESESMFHDAFERFTGLDLITPVLKEETIRIIDNIKVEFMKYVEKSNPGTSVLSKIRNVMKILQVEFGLKEFHRNETAIKEHYIEVSIGEEDYFEKLMTTSRILYLKDSSYFSQYVVKNSVFLVPDNKALYINLSMKKIVATNKLFWSNMFSTDYPSYVNYGRFGFAIAHELGHLLCPSGRGTLGFDNQNPSLGTTLFLDQLNKFDTCTSGNFDHYYKSMFDNSKNYEVVNIIAASENIADYIGADVAFNAWNNNRNVSEELEGWGSQNPEKLFFYSFGTLLCQLKYQEPLKSKDNFWWRLFPKFRVQNTLQNLHIFKQVFDCKQEEIQKTTQQCSLFHNSQPFKEDGTSEPIVSE